VETTQQAELPGIPPGAVGTLTEPTAALVGEFGLQEWRRVSPLLTAAHLLSPADVPALMQYCAAFDRWRRAEAELAAAGSGALTVETDRGGVKPNPLLRISRDAARDCLALAREFGLTPASRARLGEAAGMTGCTEADPADREFFDV